MRPPLHVSAQISYAVTAALAIGLADATTIALHVAGAHRTFEYTPPRTWVVAPLCWAIAALVLLIPALLIARARAASAVVAAMIAIGGAARMEGAWTVTRGIVAVIAVIIACWTAWTIGRRWVARPRIAAAALALIATAALGAAATLFFRTTGRAPSANIAPPDAPNVVMLFLDTVGYAPLMSDPPPNTAALMRSGVVFDRAYADASWTLPSHLSAVTGIPSQALGIDFDHQRYTLSAPTLAEQFRRRGYRTGAVISNTFLNQGSGFQRGFDLYEHAESALDVCRTAIGTLADGHWTWFAATVCNWPASEVTRRLVAQMRDDDHPYFLVANYMDAHNPYYVEPRCRPPGFAQPSQSATAPADYRRRYYPAHLAAIRCIDGDLGTILEKARQSRRATVVVIAADHGEHFGEKGLERHGNSLYVQLLHVPLIVSAPWLAPARVAAPLDLAQLPAIVNAAAARAPLPPPPGMATAVLVPPRVISRDRAWSVVLDRWHFIVHDSGAEEVFDMTSDPAEAAPLRADRVPADVMTRLRAESLRLRRSAAASQEQPFRALGYVQ
jgi:hypothetical protein